jgi:hypothetical protein
MSNIEPENQAGEGVQETSEQVAAREAQEAADRSSQEGNDKGELARARAEAAKYRTTLRDTEARLKALEDEKLTDGEKVTKQLQDVTASNATLLEQNRSLMVQVVAAKVGINPDLVDAIPAMIQWDDVEDLRGLEKSLKQLVKDRPSLAGKVAEGVDQNEGGNGSQQQSGDMNAILRRAAGRA